MNNYETEFGCIKSVKFANAIIVNDSLDEIPMPKCEKCKEREAIYHVHSATHTHHYCYECSDLSETRI